jgi:hypothetical protein
MLSVAISFNQFYKPITTEYENSQKPGDVYNNTFDAITDMKSILSKAGWVEKTKKQWVRPGKKEGISATLGKVAENVFYVFSSNAYPFEPMHGYTPFQVKGLIEFNGDFKECAKSLVKQLDLKLNKLEQPKITIKETEITVDEKRERLNKALINTDIEIEKPPIILYINDIDGTYTVRKRLLTLGNFSAINGKAKSRKTFCLTMFEAALVNNNNIYNKFYASLPTNKRQCIHFDTEQGLYDSTNVVKRIERLANCSTQHFAGFNIREYSPFDRCSIIEDALSIIPNIGFVAIDGIADLAKAINDEEEATRVTGLLLRWTKQYDCHISTIIHQNKNDNFSTGHLGSSIMKKAEIVISVAKEKGSKSNSLVSNELSRGIDFEDFSFFINDKGLPELCQYETVEQKPERWYD